MSEDMPIARITRDVDTDLETADLWSLVAVGEAWAEWMVDRADIEVEEGATGTVVDDAVVRDVRIDRVEESRSVSFTWWPQVRPDQVSTVRLVVVPARSGSRLHVTETYSTARASAAAVALAWDVRSIVLMTRALLVST